MKRKVISAVLILMLCLSLWITCFAAQTPTAILDEANLLTVSEEASLQAKLESISSTYNAQIIVATVTATDGLSADSYVNYLYDSMDFGFGEDRSGVLLLVCMDLREFRILSNGAANDAIGSYEIESISDAIVSDMSDGDYADAFDTFAEKCAYYLDGHINGFPFDWTHNLVVALIIGLVAGLIVAFSLKAQLKSVRRQNQADVYVKSGSMDLTTRSDLYLYRNVTRVKKETNSSGSRSGGSSRSVGGRSF